MREPKAGQHACVSVCSRVEEARRAFDRLRQQDFGLERVSVLGRGSHGVYRALGMHHRGGKCRFHGIQSDLWSGLWQHLHGAALMWLPGFGPLAAAGPVTLLLLRAPGSGAFTTGFGKLEQALYEMGIPADDVRAYVHCLSDDTLLLIVHDGREQVERAYQLLHPVSQQLTVHHA